MRGEVGEASDGMRVLVCERDAGVRGELVATLRAAGFETSELDEPPRVAAHLARRRHAAVFIDLRDERDWLAIEQARAGEARPAVIAASSAHQPGLGLGALRRGARELLRKPFAAAELERAVWRAIETARADAAGEELPDPASRRLLGEARAAAAGTNTLLIHGEPGSGRRWLTRWIHRGGPRAAEPCVLQECGSLPSHGAGDELFAPVRESALGRARAGHLVLYDVGRLPASAQRGLLELLQRPLAPATPRIIAIATGSWESLRSGGRLRADLAERLDVWPLAVPPLRERPEDVAWLARRFLRRLAREIRSEPAVLDDAAADALRARPWPGNVRELEALMRRAALLFPGESIDLAALVEGRATARVDRHPDPRTLNLRDLERRTIERSLDVCQGNRTRASELLGISVRTLRNKLRAYGLR